MIKYVSINNIGVIDLEDFIRILAIVPYEGMGTLLRRAAEEFPQLTVDIFEGNMEQAVQIANQHFPAGYDIVLSRGGTAQLLRSTGFPVVDVDISLYDTLCALKLCDGLIGKVALVAYANITINARILCELMQYNIDVYTLESVNDLDPKLQQLLHEGYSTVLCDMTAYNIARKLGLNSILITSGMESIRKALYQAESMLQYHRKLLEDNRFYLSALQTQRNTVIIENETKEIFLCTMEDIPSGLLDQLQNAVPDPGSPVPGHFTRQIQEGLFHITAFPLLRGSHAYTVFYLKKQVLPICSNQVGIRCSSPRDVEEYATQTLFSFSTLHPMLWNSLVEQARSCTPLLFCGERGTGKHILISQLFCQQHLCGDCLIQIDCATVTEKGWSFLLENYDSPLLETHQVLYLSNVDQLPDKRLCQLVEIMRQLDTCSRNQVVFSCLNKERSCLAHLENLNYSTISLPALHEIKDLIPTLLHLILSRLNTSLPVPILGATPDAIQLLQEYHWPHNYSQFQRVICEITAQVNGSTITRDHVKAILAKEMHSYDFHQRQTSLVQPLDLNRPLHEIDREIALLVLQECNGNQSATAKQLGISRTTLWRLLKEE